MDVIFDWKNGKLKQASFLFKNAIVCFISIAWWTTDHDERSKRTNIRDFGYRFFKVHNLINAKYSLL